MNGRLNQKFPVWCPPIDALFGHREQSGYPLGASRMLARNDQCGGKGDGDEGTSDSPNPAPEGKCHDNGYGRERKTAPLQHRIDEVANGNLQRCKTEKHNQRHAQALKLDNRVQTRRDNADDVADDGNEIQQEVQNAPYERKLEAYSEGP